MQILYEDNHIVALNKGCHDLVQADKSRDATLIDATKAYLKEKYHKPGNVFLGCVHRLDRPVTGVVLFAKTSKMLARLNELFHQREGIEKTYWAIVKKQPPQAQGRLENYLYKNEKQNKSYVAPASLAQEKKAKLAVLEYKIIAQSDNYFLLEIRLLTGRHHQIRCQLSHLGCPIKGDLKYGFPRSNDDGGICLHARKITFIHPVKKEKITIVAPTPQDKLWQVLQKNL